MSKYISRATFLKGLAGFSLAGVSAKLYLDFRRPQSQFPCRVLGPSRSLGHMLRDGQIPKGNTASIKTEDKRVTIIGGGMAGLSAAWWLKRKGIDDFVLLELENNVGGNAASGKNEYSAYPWGAHYIPMANQESQYVRLLFEELGVITGFDQSNKSSLAPVPIYNELYLCHDPQERLLKDGFFQDGLLPHRGLQPDDREQTARFFQTMYKYRSEVGRDGKPAFAIPLDLSSQDSQYVSLDQLSMADWLKQNGFTSRPLTWYVNYCCRDDYGSTLEHVSAWAGVHYFAGRRGIGANGELNSVITWPEGNGFVVNQLKKCLSDHLRTGCLVSSVKSEADSLLIELFCADKSERAMINSDYAIFAAPRFIAKYIISGYAKELNFGDLTYAPWLVANISLRAVPDGKGVGLSWDNVSYLSDSLGYVVANHQDITTRQGPNVITYYYPLSAKEPAAERGQMLSISAQQWSQLITADLEKMHPGITAEIISMDIWPWGHGMIRPSVGYIWGETRKKLKESAASGKIVFAHSDMSGISNFEEAQYHGVQAAIDVLSRLKQA